MGTRVLQKGGVTYSGATGYNTPTNPRVRNDNTHSSTDRLFTLIYPDDSTSSETFVEVGTSTVNTERNNLTNTAGYRIKCYDSIFQEGVQLTGGNYDSDYHYFVLIHSDNSKKHHFARITEPITDDVAGDAFEFTPVLGKEIPENTKFMVFKGPIKTTKAIAFSAGIKASLQSDLVVSSPLFHLLESSLNKKDELDHNTKYFLRLQANDSSVTTTIDTSSQGYVFLTEQEFSNKILDYSKYTMQLSLIDNLRTQDNPSTNTSNEGHSVSSVDVDDYDEVFPNARRDSDDDFNTAFVTEGPIRYLHYDYSPTKVNALDNVLDNKLEQSVGNRGGYCETKILNPSRMLTTKITDFDKYRVRHRVFTGQLNDFVDMKIEIDSLISGASDPRYLLNTDYSDPSLFINAGDEVKIGTQILICNTIAYSSSAAKWTIIFEHPTNNGTGYARTETEALFSTPNLMSLTGTLQRRAYNYQDNTILTTFNLLDGRTDELYVKTHSKDMESLESTVTAVDANHGLITLNSNSQSYSGDSSLRYSLGSYSIEVERFTGTIENISSYKEDSQNFVDLNGRSDISKLMGPIINKNAAFSEDIVYSSDSPYNSLSVLSQTAGCAFDDKTLTFASNITMATGDKVYVKFANNNIVYVGEIETGATDSTFELVDYPMSEFAAKTMYKAASKHYVLNKALASSLLVDSATSLSGASDKGLFFQSGTKISASATAFEGNTLIGSSSENADGEKYNAKAVGFYNSEVKAMKSDNPFQTRLHDNSTDYETFDTVNTLLDFTILSVKEENGSKRVELAPYLPLTLGRVQYNYANTQDTTFASYAGTTSNSGTGSTRIVETDILTFDGKNLYSTDSIQRRFHQCPLYINEVFVGIILQVEIKNDANYNKLQIFLDRQATWSSSKKVYVLTYDGTYNESTKLSHELLLLNGAHLHGGKIITKLHPLKANGTIYTFDYPLYYGSGSYPVTYGEKFGSSYFRIYNLEKGNINVDKQIGNYFSEKEELRYYDKPSKISYYAGAYRFGRGYYYSSGIIDNLIGTNQKADGQNHILHESRGFDSVQGSKFWDTTVHAANETPTYFGLQAYNGESLPHYSTKDTINQIDSKVARMFLFSNADLLPYTSTRKDSLMTKDGSGNYKDITNYNLFSLVEPTTSSNSDSKHLLTGSTSTITHNDDDYVSSGIISSDKTVGQLKRFGMMRLTELVFDWHFNQFDPENPPDKSKVLPIASTTIEGATTVNITSATRTNTKTLTFEPNFTLTLNDKLYDSKGRFIGVVANAATSLDGSSIVVVFDEEPFKTNGENFATGAFTRIETGHEESETILGFKNSIVEVSQIRMLASFMTQDATELTASGTTFHNKYGAELKVRGASVGTNYSTHSTLPIHLRTTEWVSGSISGDIALHESKFFEMMANLPEADTGSALPNNLELYMKYFIPIILDRWSIADGSELADSGMSADEIQSIHGLFDTTGSSNEEYFRIGLHLASPFKDKQSISDSSATSYSKTSDGVHMGFKPVLRIDTTSHVSESNNKGIGNSTVYHYKISSQQYYKWLDFVDLTGCYLVSTTGKYYDDDGAVADLTDGQSLDEVTPTTICYVLSHEVDESSNVTAQAADANSLFNDTVNSREHIITVSAQLPNGTSYRIMQPNHTCFHEYSPKKIRLNTLSSKYTKKPYEDKMFDEIKPYQYRAGLGGRTDKGNNEGILSMYLALDSDSISDDTHIVTTNYAKFDDLFGTLKVNSCISDGETILRTSLEYLTNGDAIGHYLQLGDMKELIGVVSASEIFSILVNGNVDKDSKRAMIGSTVTICSETEKLANELLEENDITFDINDGDYPLFLAPNYQGVDLFSAINYLLEQKDKVLFTEADTFKIKDKDDSNFYKGIVLNEDGKYQIYDFEESKNLFNFYNEITVYGRTHKHTRKNIKSINKNGRKALEVFDNKLSTQDDVNKKTSELLRLHSSDNKKLKITVGHEGISQIKVGDNINVEIPRENIPVNKYMVLQIEYLLTGLMELQLGKYSKSLEDRFADLLIETNNINSKVRNQNFKDSSSLDFLEDMKVKGLRVLIRKKSFPTAGFPLGFSTPLNTGTSPLGLSSGSITYTTLLDEELE